MKDDPGDGQAVVVVGYDDPKLSTSISDDHLVVTLTKVFPLVQSYVRCRCASTGELQTARRCWCRLVSWIWKYAALEN